MTTLAMIALVLALVPALLWTVNMWLFHAPGPATPKETADPPGISVLIPARHEEDRLGPTLESVRANDGIDLEIIVYDDHSTDGTAELVRDHARSDNRVRLMKGGDLPDGWCGKQHACWELSQAARHDILCFIDADVRLSEDALRRIAGELKQSRSQLISGFPRQETKSFGEKLLISFIPYILLGFLPIWFMRRFNHPGLAAGCGQLMIAERDAYREVGGHSAIRQSRHDGITLPAAFRRNGYHTDLFDAKDIAVARMYDGFRSTWNGLAKNATEGMARPEALPVFTVLLLGGQVLPAVLLPLALLVDGGCTTTLYAGAGVLLSSLPRLSGVLRFGQSALSALLHPIGVMVLMANQWFAFLRSLLGGSAEWRGRTYDG